MTFRDYAYNKLSVKLNLLLSRGEKSKGVLDKKVIDNLFKNFNENVNDYYINYKGSFPIEFVQLSDVKSIKHITSDLSINNINGVRITWNDGSTRLFFINQYINFNKMEYRNQKMNALIK